ASATKRRRISEVMVVGVIGGSLLLQEFECCKQASAPGGPVALPMDRNLGIADASGLARATGARLDRT
ncbi:MAG TPA: hypothetical protein VMF12_00555, partial [Xanthobacteraceae bacterium]|nr:hypothetical protein [Xanthobacteraceae bacterium]